MMLPVRAALFTAAGALLFVPSPEAPAQRKLTSQPARVRELCNLRWHAPLEHALAEATKQARPVMVFRVLGELDGFM